jgi:hypothetical protein
LEIKEMSLKEKYEKLFDDYLLVSAMVYAFHKKLGVVDKCYDWVVKVRMKMLPSLMPIAFKLMKTVAPGTVFKKAVDNYLYEYQFTLPLSTLEVTRVSDREAVLGVKNCVILQKARELVKKAGLDIDPKFMCEEDSTILPRIFKEFGIDVTWELEENGCRIRAKLK